METSQAKTIGQVLDRTGASEARHCERHGDYIARKITANFWTRCPQCDEERAKKREEEARARLEEEARANRLTYACIPPRFCSKSFSDFVSDTADKRRALEAAQAYVDGIVENFEKGACLALCGKAGTGKTHLAIAIAKEAINRGYGALFTSVMRAVREVKETYRRDSETSEREAIRKFTGPHLLVLDEVGVQFGTDAEKLILFEIINGRYEQMKPTVVISNLAKEGLQEYLGERAFDRLRENGGRLVVFDWDSYRGKA